MLNKLLKLKDRLDNNWFYAIALAIFTLVVLSAVYLFHFYAFFTNQDNVSQFYTWYQELATNLHNGQLPIWGSGTRGGWPLAAEMQPGILYPLNWLWVAVFGSIHGISETALNFLVALHFWIAGFGAFLLVKELGSKRWIAFLGGVTFAFSGMIAMRSSAQVAIFFGLTYICYPVYFMAKYRHDAKRRIRWPILAGIFLSMTLLTGHVGPFIYALMPAVIFEGIYIIRDLLAKRSVKQFIFSLKGLVIVGVVSLIVALPQLFISLPYLTNSYRVQLEGYMGPEEKISYQIFSQAFVVEIKDFANMVDPIKFQVIDGNYFYMGLVPLLIVFIVAYIYRNKLRTTKLWKNNVTFITALMIIGFLTMVGYTTWIAAVMYKTPFIYELREPGRYVVIFSLALILVFAAALEVIVNQKLNKKQKYICLVVGGFLLLNSAYILMFRNRIFSLHYALQTGLLAAFLLTLALVGQLTYRKIIITALVLMTAAVNVIWFTSKPVEGTMTPASYENLPKQLTGLLEQTDGQYRVAIEEDSIPVNAGNMFNFQTTGGYSATIYAPYFEFAHKDAFSRGVVNDFMGVKYSVFKKKPAKGDIVYEDKANQVYVVKRPNPLSKIFATNVWGSSDRKDYYSLDVKTVQYDDMRQKYQLNLDKDTNVILSEIYYPGWAAKVDGKKVEISEYSIGQHKLFKSISVPTGQHTVELTYKPFGIF